ncbi:hypothetical protein HDU76_008785, partial [Blyttiomyces sp. JEL0837]
MVAKKTKSDDTEIEVKKVKISKKDKKSSKTKKDDQGSDNNFNNSDNMIVEIDNAEANNEEEDAVEESPKKKNDGSVKKKGKKRKVESEEEEEKKDDEDAVEEKTKKPAKRGKKAEQEEEEPQEQQQDQDMTDNNETEEKPEDEIPPELRLDNYNLTASTKKALIDTNRPSLFPIQAACFAKVMGGKDLLGRARTGTGKTLAFTLPIVETLKRDKAGNPAAFNKRGRAPFALIMAPTRELANQVFKEFECIGAKELQMVCVYGGAPYEVQNRAFYNGVDIVIGTPGRLIDHVERGTLKLHNLRFICLDEADQMLDIGFADSMEKVLQQTSQQKQSFTQGPVPPLQTLLFSATVPDWISGVLSKYMRPDRETVDLVGSQKLKTSEKVKHLCIPSRWQNRADVLGDIVAVYGRGGSSADGNSSGVSRTIIFVETKGEANELGLNEKLASFGIQVLHGDVQQKQREIAIQGFRDGKFRCLVTTNVCARGVDIPEVDLVVNCEPPGDVETYIHRSGRTGRAGKSGVCITFYKNTQQYLLNNISRRAGVQFKTIGAPQPKDIVASHTAESLLAFHKNDPIMALSAALAVICNTTKPIPARSLLSANEGFQTLLFKTSNTIRNVGFVRAILQRNHPGLGYEDTIGWRMTKDEKGVVVDVNAAKIEVLDGGDGEGGDGTGSVRARIA